MGDDTSAARAAWAHPAVAPLGWETDLTTMFVRCLRRGEVVVFTLASQAHVPPVAGGYSFVEFSARDLSEPGIFQEKDRPRFFPLRLGSGYRCFGWRDTEGNVAGYLWLATSVAPPAPWVLGLGLRLDRGHAYIWDCRTAPAHEGKGLYGAGLLEVAAAARRASAEIVLIDSNPANSRSLGAIERVGFRRRGVASVRHLGLAWLVHWCGARRIVSREFDSAVLTGPDMPSVSA